MECYEKQVLVMKRLGFYTEVIKGGGGTEIDRSRANRARLAGWWLVIISGAGRHEVATTTTVTTTK